MPQTSFTSGPWEIVPRTFDPELADKALVVNSVKSESYATGIVLAVGVESDDPYADAKLIAAAPELFALVKVVRTALQLEQLIPNPRVVRFDDRAFKTCLSTAERLVRMVEAPNNS